MKMKKLPDLLLNVALPITLGSALYLVSFSTNITGFARNQLPDGLWAYAFISCILIIWNRTINPIWMAGTISTAIIFEGLQWRHFIEGTGDLHDVTTYIAFFAIALMGNLYFQKRYQPKPVITKSHAHESY